MFILKNKKEVFENFYITLSLADDAFNSFEKALGFLDSVPKDLQKAKEINIDFRKKLIESISLLDRKLEEKIVKEPFLVECKKENAFLRFKSFDFSCPCCQLPSSFEFKNFHEKGKSYKLSCDGCYNTFDFFIIDSEKVLIY